MENLLLERFADKPVLVAIISIALNVVIAISGILPSTFITVGTVGIMGLKIGLFILIIGEATGAIVSFYLYRKGFHKLSSRPKFFKFNNRSLLKLKKTSGITAFLFVILLRLLPFVPSGAVSLTAAISKIGILSFSIASTLGKIPALIIEAYSISIVIELKPEGQLGIVTLIFLFFLFLLLWKRVVTKNKDR
ncbi:TVP38/TMEM64 family protein [Bacillus sp. CGMCC 1.16607]|uniref:TVP38/TMEM64 family protein n=1 Tax=Bacillus sp. CGMCC 1.16607 TaxID=3351842 RepID=UPI00362800C0